MKKESINLKIGEFIRICRQKENLSVRQLGKKSGVNYTVIYRLEGTMPFENLNPKIHSLTDILKALNKNLFDLFQYVYQKK